MEVNADELTQALAEETINLIEEFSSGMDFSAKSRILEMYLSNLVSFLISDTFNQIETGTPKEERLERARREFSGLKSTIEFAVSDGVQRGISLSTGKELGYYCLIRPIPEAINKTVM